MIAKTAVIVSVSFDDAPWREMAPEAVVVDSVAEVPAIIQRALDLGAIVVVDRAEEGDAADEADDPDLVDWPADRHVIRRTKADLARLANQARPGAQP